MLGTKQLSTGTRGCPHLHKTIYFKPNKQWLEVQPSQDSFLLPFHFSSEGCNLGTPEDLAFCQLLHWIMLM